METLVATAFLATFAPILTLSVLMGRAFVMIKEIIFEKQADAKEMVKLIQRIYLDIMTFIPRCFHKHYSSIIISHI